MPVTDDFNRSNGGLGANWERVRGTADWEINTNAARATSNFDQPVMRRTESAFPDDQYTQLKCSFTTGGNAAETGPGVRFDGSGNGYYVRLTQNLVTLFRRSGGADNYLGEATVTAPTASTLYTVKLEAIGTAIKVYFGGSGTASLSITDSGISSGKPGIYHNGNTDHPFVDDFECTDATPAGQMARPDSDVSAGSWTATPLYAKVDEVSANDADYIESPSAPSNSICELGLSDVTDPESSATHTLRVRRKKSASSSNQIDMRYRVVQGAAEIASWTDDNNIGTDWSNVSRTLTSGQADAITDYANLRVELRANQVSQGTSIPTFLAAGTAASGTAGVTPGLPAGYAADDIFLLFCETANEAVTAPSGYTAVADSPQGTGTAGGTTATRLSVFWKRATASETAPTVADPGNHVIAQILAFRGCVASSDPWDVTSGDTGASSTSVTIPGDTTTVANCLIVMAVANAFDSATSQTSGWANPDLSNVAELTAANSNTASGNGGGFGVATGGKATIGTYGSTTATLANATVQGRMTIALKPLAQTDVKAQVSWIEFETPLYTGPSPFRRGDACFAMVGS